MCPCYWILRSPKTREMVGQILIEVDDLMMAGRGPVWDQFVVALKQRFSFGKWEDNGSADFNGR